MRPRKVTFFIGWVINKIFYCICSVLQLRNSCAYRMMALDVWISSSFKRAYGLGHSMGIMAWGRGLQFCGFEICKWKVLFLYCFTSINHSRVFFKLWSIKGQDPLSSRGLI